MRVIRSPLINVLVGAVERASGALRRDIGEADKLHSSRKGVADFTTSADLRAEQTLLRYLRKARPDYAVLSEERGFAASAADSNATESNNANSNAKSNADSNALSSHRARTRTSSGAGVNSALRCFIVDPLDGTLNFMHAFGHISISLAVEEGGEIIAGVVHDPLRFETFWAERGVGAFLGDERLRVSKRVDLEDGLFATTLSFSKKRRDATGKDRFLRRISCILDRCEGFRISGSAALDLAYVAAGRLDGFWAEGLEVWDCAAGLLLVEMAGGAIGNLSVVKQARYGVDVKQSSYVRRSRSIFSRCRDAGIVALADEVQLSNFRTKILN